MDLKTLTEINAPSGHEQPIRRALLAELKSKDVPFRRTEDRDTCAYCDFKMICGR